MSVERNSFNMGLTQLMALLKASMGVSPMSMHDMCHSGMKQ
jgi:hypothetical protein